MAIRQLKSGNWNIRKMVDGRSYSVTIDHKPTDREAERLISAASGSATSGARTSRRSFPNTPGEKTIMPGGTLHTGPRSP